MKKVWMCFHLDFGTSVHPQDKFQPWPAKVRMISDAEFPNKKAAEKYLKDTTKVEKGFFFVQEIFKSDGSQ